MFWQEPVAGFQYQSAVVTITADFQHEKLSACGLDPEVFEDQADASFFIAEAIRAGINSGISAEGNVNMLQTLIQHRPALLGEPLTVAGQITSVTAVPRGMTIDTEVVFRAEGGEPVITANRRSLKPDPVRSARRGAGERPPPVIDDVTSLETVARHVLTPEMVKAYSSEGNSIHYDMDAARRAGFRAPLIGGGMGVHYMMAYLKAAHAPRALHLDIYFRRPIFWDDAFRVAVAADATAICLEKEGKVATEARIQRLE